MSKKSSPSSGPTRRKRSRPAGQSGVAASRPGGGFRSGTRKSAAAEFDQASPRFSSKMRTFLPVVLVPHAVAVAAIISVSLVVLLSTSTTMVALPATIAMGWLLLNALPVHGADLDFSVLPLLPALLFAWVIAVRVRRAVRHRVSLADLGVLFLCVVGIPSLLTLTAAAMLLDASEVFDVGVPNIAVAVGKTVVLHGSAMVLGMPRKLWRALCGRMGVPQWLVAQAITALYFLAAVVVLSAVVVVVSLFVHHAAVVESLAGYSSAGVAAVVGVCVAAFPNAAISAVALVSGSEFQMGSGAVSVFGSTLVPLPPIPLFAALPQSAHPAGVALLVIPIVAAMIAVVRRVPRLYQVPGLVGFVFVFSLVLFQATSGQLGVYGATGPRLISSVFVAAFMLVVAVVTSGVTAVVRRSRSRVDAPTPSPVAEPLPAAEVVDDCEQPQDFEHGEVEVSEEVAEEPEPEAAEEEPEPEPEEDSAEEPADEPEDTPNEEPVEDEPEDEPKQD